MDGISHLLRMAQLEAQLDKRCLLSAATRMDVTPGDERDVPFHVLLEGECQIEVDGVLHSMTAGDVVIIPSGARHRITTAGAGPARSTSEVPGTSFATTTSLGGDGAVIDLFCGHYRVGAGAGSILFGSLPTPTHVSLFRSEDGKATLTQLSGLMRAEAHRDGAGSAAIMSAFCTVLIALVLRTATGAGTHDRVWTAVPDRRLSAVIQQVLESPGAGWSIEGLSRQSAMSRATFMRHFQAATGMTFGQFLSRARLMSAADLLTTSDLTVAAIAARVGYRSESAFTRAFQTETGETPARFRRNQRPARLVS